MLEEMKDMKIRAVIVDIDGTIALRNERGPFEYEKCDTDSPNKPIIEIVRRYIKDPYVNVIYVSGREDTCRKKTEAWIAKYVGGTPGLLHMRPAGDFRKDTIIKKEIYDQHIKGKYNVLFVLDDRNQVVEMWRQQGLTCLQVAEGDF